MTTKELHGIYHELNFWRGFVKTERFLNGWVKKVKTPELQQSVADFIKSVPHNQVADVGSGVVSILNGLIPVTAIDPLGELYQLVFDYKAHKLAHPLPFPAEEMPAVNHFDIVHCSNAIDHTQQPILAYETMMNAVKPKGYLILQGFENEGTHENWQGFHQHDIYVDAKTLCIKNQLGQMIIMDVDPTHLEFVEFEGKRWFIWIKQKK
jgi:SAM-dependent methyltransferase